MVSDSLIKVLWPEGSGPQAPQVYALVDGAHDDLLSTSIRQSQLPYVNLFAGNISPELERASPFLVQLSPMSKILETLINSPSVDWGVFVICPPEITLQALRKHLRTWLLVQDAHGKNLLFRFYDPRVLRVFLPTCTSEEINKFFGPIDHMIAASAAAGEMLSFSQHRGQLTKTKLHLPNPRVSHAIHPNNI